jgi:predicted RNA-binding Zn-ribbon protein involved in translation (DUF1610 family)
MPVRSSRKFECVTPPASFRPGPRPQGASDEAEKGRQSPPRCPNCGIETLWYQSRLQRQNGSSKIVHSYHCPNCAMIVQTEEPMRHGLRVV